MQDRDGGTATPKSIFVGTGGARAPLGRGGRDLGLGPIAVVAGVGPILALVCVGCSPPPPPPDCSAESITGPDLARQVSEVTVSPASSTIEAGERQRFSASARCAEGALASGASFAWSTDDPSVATVDDSGLATGVAEGVARITAAVEGGSARGTATLTVERAPGPPTDRIAFASDRAGPDDMYEIYSVAVDGSDLRRLTETRCPVATPENPGSSNWPAWSPDGERIAFSRICTLPSSELGQWLEVFAMDHDGSDPTILAPSRNGGTGPSWSPTGDRIAYSSADGIRVMGRDGSANRRVLNTFFLNHGLGRPQTSSQAWFPDETYIGFHFDYVTDPLRVLFTDLQGNVSHYPEINAEGRDNASPAVGPDGTIAFVSDRSGNFDVWLFSPWDGSLRQLTTDEASDGCPAWSPDGARIAFCSARDGDLDIYVIDVESGALRQLTDHPGRDLNPTWSPSSP